MYHIKNDTRSKMSAELIYNGLTQLLETEKYDTLSITQITNMACVGRATFYRLFDNKDDILIYKLDAYVQELLEQSMNNIFTHPNIYEYDIYLPAFTYWIKHSDFLRQLLHCGLYYLFTNKITEVMRHNLIADKNNMGLTDKECEYMICTRIAIVAESLKLTVQQYPNDSAVDIINILISIFGNRKLK